MALEANFGSVERWRDGFRALAKTLVDRLDSSGRIVLSFQPRQGTLVNQWVADLADVSDGGVPLLTLTKDELARHGHDGAPAGACVDAFMTKIDWADVYARYQSAVHVASDPCGARQDELEGALLLDVRRAGAYAQAVSVINGARWCDPRDGRDMGS
jgi:Fe-Mn family superoxide dismutase